jgi:hypothetical protein
VEPVGAVRSLLEQLGESRLYPGRWRSRFNSSASGDRACGRRARGLRHREDVPDVQCRLVAGVLGPYRSRISARLGHNQMAACPTPVHRRLPQRALPQHRIRSARSAWDSRLRFFIPVCAFGTAPGRGVMVRPDDYRCPPNPDRPITKPGFPHRGFCVTTAFEFALSAGSAGSQFSDWNGSPIKRFLIPAN